MKHGEDRHDKQKEQFYTVFVWTTYQLLGWLTATLTKSRSWWPHASDSTRRRTLRRNRTTGGTHTEQSGKWTRIQCTASTRKVPVPPTAWKKWCKPKLKKSSDKLSSEVLDKFNMEAKLNTSVACENPLQEHKLDFRIQGTPREQVEQNKERVRNNFVEFFVCNHGSWKCRCCGCRNGNSDWAAIVWN